MPHWQKQCRLQNEGTSLARQRYSRYSKKWQVIMEEEDEDGDDDDGDDADESGGIELGAEERKEMLMNLREEQTGFVLR